MSFTENLAPFFSTSDFAVTATLEPGAVSVIGIFDNGYAERLGLAGTDPGFLAPSADLSSASEGCLLVVAGTPYTIRGIEPDGTGITLLQLETYPANGFDRGFDAGFGD